MEKKLARQPKYKRKVDSLCTLLCDRLANTASFLSKTLEFKVWEHCFSFRWTGHWIMNYEVVTLWCKVRAFECCFETQIFCMLKLQRFLSTMYLCFGLKTLKSLSKSFDNFWIFFFNVVYIWLKSSGGMYKDRLVSFGGKVEVVIRFCSFVSQVMVFSLKSNSLSQDEVRSLPVMREFGVSIRMLFCCGEQWTAFSIASHLVSFLII